MIRMKHTHDYSSVGNVEVCIHEMLHETLDMLRRMERRAMRPKKRATRAKETK